MAKKKGKSGKSDSGEPGVPASVKKFRQSPEIEGFYRFIYENDLRTEAFAIVDKISQERAATKSKKKTKAKSK